MSASELSAMYTRDRSKLTCNECKEEFNMYSSTILQDVIKHTKTHSDADKVITIE